MFQFHIGAIKRMIDGEVDPKDIGFNSILVRLKAND